MDKRTLWRKPVAEMTKAELVLALRLAWKEFLRSGYGDWRIREIQAAL